MKLEPELIFNVPVAMAFILGIITAFFSSRLSGISERIRYRLLAFLPLAMFLSGLFMTAWDSSHSINKGFAFGIFLAFGFAFSLANLRIPSIYSRIIGSFFILFHAYLLYCLIIRNRFWV